MNNILEREVAYRTIEVKPGGLALVNESDFELVSTRKWHIAGRGYAYTTSSPRGSMHRLIMNAQKGQVIDHINNNKLDNRRSNLRFVSHSVNLQRRTSIGLFGRGVYRTPKGRYRAQMFIKGVGVHLGVFDTIEEAMVAYDRRAILEYGNLAFTNLPLDHIKSTTETKGAV